MMKLTDEIPNLLQRTGVALRQAVNLAAVAGGQDNVLTEQSSIRKGGQGGSALIRSESHPLPDFHRGRRVIESN
jgi:hypothetical protein